MRETRKFVIWGIAYLACSALLLASRFCYLSKSTGAGVRQPAGRYERLKSRELGYSGGEPNGNAPRLNRVWGFFVPLVRNLYCQIEYGYSDSDTGMPCGKTPWLNVVTADLRSVPTVAWNAAGIPSAVSARTTTSLIHV